MENLIFHWSQNENDIDFFGNFIKLYSGLVAHSRICWIKFSYEFSLFILQKSDENWTSELMEEHKSQMN